MISQDQNGKLDKILKKLPDAPGVYLFKHGSKILYIGKATSLRDRVRSYFRLDVVETRSPLVSKMLSEFNKVDHIKTDSVLEALVLEAHLIKKYQPEANIKEKDNKSFNFVVITKEEYPRVLIMRGRELLNNPTWKLSFQVAYSFGPFPNASQLREAMKIVRKMFPYRDKCEPNSGKPCFNRQIGLCPGVCTGEISKEDYAKRIKNIILFFEGNKKKLMKNLEKQMKSFAKNREFEKANLTKRTLFTLNHIQDIALIKEHPVNSRGVATKEDAEVAFRIESYDVAHMAGQNVVGVMTVLEDGELKKSDYRKFKIRWFDKLTTGNESSVNDTKALSEILERRLAHIEWRFPDLIVVDGGTAQKKVMEKVLLNNKLDIPVVSVVKDERHRPREILGDRSIALTTGKKWPELEKEILLANAESHRYGIAFHKSLRKISR